MTEAVQDAIQELRALLPPGTKVYTVLNHVSRSGMMRAIDVRIASEGGITGIPYMETLGFVWNKRHGGYTMGGCGMDMGFALVYDLSRIIYRDGFDCLGDRCPSSDHVNIRDGTSIPKHHKDGAYALRHEWI